MRGGSQPLRSSLVRRRRERERERQRRTHPHELDEGVVDPRAVREPEAAAGRQVVEEEELLVLADAAVVALGRLLEELLVVLHLGRVGERDAVDALQRLVVGVAEEVRRRVLREGEERGQRAALSRRIDEQESVGRTLRMASDLTRPVCGMCGPRHRSIMGPQR